MRVPSGTTCVIGAPAVLARSSTAVAAGPAYIQNHIGPCLAVYLKNVMSGLDKNFIFFQVEVRRNV